ncbi:hypothetical protein EJB05_24715, partial [Eragrostis curvula]
MVGYMPGKERPTKARPSPFAQVGCGNTGPLAHRLALPPAALSSEALPARGRSAASGLSTDRAPTEKENITFT